MQLGPKFKIIRFNLLYVLIWIIALSQFNYQIFCRHILLLISIRLLVEWWVETVRIFNYSTTYFVVMQGAS
jgi:hypothetical protein